MDICKEEAIRCKVVKVVRLEESRPTERPPGPWRLGAAVPFRISVWPVSRLAGQRVVIPELYISVSIIHTHTWLRRVPAA